MCKYQVGEAVEAQYVSVEDEEQLTEAPVAALHDNGNNSKSSSSTYCSCYICY